MLLAPSPLDVSPGVAWDLAGYVLGVAMVGAPLFAYLIRRF